MTLETQTQFAKRRGVGKSAVTNWKNAGLLVFAEDADGRAKVHVERSEARLNARLDPMRGRPTSGVASATELELEPVEEPALPIAASRNLAQARAELVDEDLYGRRMKNAQTAGELVALVEMERRASELGRLARERVAAELRGVAERLSATGDVRAVMAILDEATGKAFAALAASVASGVMDADDEEESEDDSDEAVAALAA
ncbi:hypothetical protein [Sphingomonas hengshuiensis]|uniref:Terminase small subunit n=1 Tax=Sphingomonas hengshuiensis TaxID=1609977 RepID=A0A7U4LFB8_9SPHN|nr:hypothetical protein [Sphingomonas hengshuiensis]AJP72275.1 hypothetical protein TS85_11470 [Sphingomonas hengshuiensis]